ncbi:MAG: hypothetical protein RR490_08870 [Niameybacter sp.]
MMDKEDEKKQFTIHLNNVNQLQDSARERLEKKELLEEEDGGGEKATIISLLRQLLEKTKLPIAALIFLLVVGGIGLTYLPDAKEVSSAEGEIVQVSATVDGSMTYEEMLEMRMETILDNLEGAGQTKVMITTTGSTEKVLAEEVVENSLDVDETSQAGNMKTSEKQDIQRKIVMEKGDMPFVIKENKPKVEGVLVLAEGADDITIKNAIIQSVSSLLDVPVHKVAVYKMVNN